MTRIKLQTLSTRDQSTSLQSDNVEDICEINNSLLIEAGVTKKNKKIVQLKDDSVYLLNDAKYILQEKPIGYLMNDGTNMD